MKYFYYSAVVAEYLVAILFAVLIAVLGNSLELGFFLYMAYVLSFTGSAIINYCNYRVKSLGFSIFTVIINSLILIWFIDMVLTYWYYDSYIPFLVSLYMFTVSVIYGYKMVIRYRTSQKERHGTVKTGN